jgi:hypothetical protein
MRLILALDNPSAGIVNINAKSYQQPAASMRKVGTLRGLPRTPLAATCHRVPLDQYSG